MVSSVHPEQREAFNIEHSRSKTETGSAPRWQFWIDRGGTFTDVVARRPSGEVVLRKVLSEDPARPQGAALRGLRAAMSLGEDAPLPSEQIEIVRMGTTVATNALLERTGAPVVFVTNTGFRDALRIGYQARPDIFALQITLPEMLHARAVEVTARVDAEGNEMAALDREAARQALREAYEAGCRACAIALMHSYRFPEHEEEVARIAREVGFEQVSASHAVSPLIKLVGRGGTAVVDAYVSPPLKRYVAGLQRALGEEIPLQLMQSSGGLAEAENFRGKDALLSGPAGGVVGAVRAGGAAGFERIISFDMGGTSTDVAHFAGDFERTFEAELAGVRLRTPMLQIHTVAAGGGSVCSRGGGGRLRVGPASAGAQPGPASYGRGGPLTITDCNVVLGKVQPDFFPEVFGEGGDGPLDAEAAHAALARLAEETGDGRAPEAVAAGFVQIAVEKMAQAIRQISLARGHDARGYALCAFGGAGGQHACLLAEALGIENVLVHPYAGVLSAYGIGVADVRALREKTVAAPLTEALVPDLRKTLDALARSATDELRTGGSGEIDVLRKAHLRYAGTDAPLVVDFSESAAGLEKSFAEAHRRRYGFVMDERALAVEAVSVEAVRRSAAPEMPEVPPRPPGEQPEPAAHVRLFAAEAWHEAPVYERERLRAEEEIEGPALVAEATGTTVIEPGWQAAVTKRGDLILTRAAAQRNSTSAAEEINPQSKIENPKSVALALFGNRFRALAEEMGRVLQSTAYSVNIKERLDFSCALFDAEGALVANAPHIPVHLGSMGASVRSLLRSHGKKLRLDDVYAQNDPYDGGTHLPDITVITPVFVSDGERPVAFVAARGHHADVGGTTPGSMPPKSTRIEDEGVLIETMKVVEGERFLEKTFVEKLKSGEHPARNPQQNVADLQAQIAANAHGAAAFRRLVETHGLDAVQTYMRRLQDHAEEAVRRVIGRLYDGEFTCALDTGEAICVAVTVDRAARRARIDFTGTSAQVRSNFNAPAAVTRAAVLYVFRTLVGEDLPLNEGCLRPLDMIIPEGSLLNPRPPAAVVAGNVETSQLVTDALYGALGVMAAAQGTMNNVTFGNARYQYYETLGGGTGAGQGFDGASGVQCHMTNSRLTDPEVLEHRLPVVVEHFGLRTGSGGAGKHRGGDGLVRKLRFREAMTAAILSSRRRVAPHGLFGGAPGAKGRNRIARADGTMEELSGTAVAEMEAGDVLIIETPGGGGYGAPGAQDAPGGRDGPAEI